MSSLPRHARAAQGIRPLHCIAGHLHELSDRAKKRQERADGSVLSGLCGVHTRKVSAHVSRATSASAWGPGILLLTRSLLDMFGGIWAFDSSAGSRLDRGCAMEQVELGILGRYKYAEALR